ncbi:hypothetical protein D3C72_1828450 [compost metagenome]
MTAVVLKTSISTAPANSHEANGADGTGYEVMPLLHGRMLLNTHLQLKLHAKFHYPVGRDLEEIGCPGGVAIHPDKQPFTPAHHTR